MAGFPTEEKRCSPPWAIMGGFVAPPVRFPKVSKKVSMLQLCTLYSPISEPQELNNVYYRPRACHPEDP
jgi:hypothetical protein